MNPTPTITEIIRCASREASLRRVVYAKGVCALKPDVKARELKGMDTIVSVLGWIKDRPAVVSEMVAAGVLAEELTTGELL